MRNYCCQKKGETACLMFLLSAAALIFFSCTTETVLSDTAESPDETEVHNQSVAAAEIPFISETDNTDDPLKSKTTLEEVSLLWHAGFHDDARLRFNAENTDKDDEWHLWRGRLFIEQWSGSDLGLAGENISALLSDNDDIWAGTWTGGVIRFSVPLGTPTVWDPGLPSLAVRTVNRILSDNGVVRVLRYASLERYNKRSGKWFTETDLPASDRLQDLCIINNKTYLATLGYGLWVKTGVNWQKIDYPGLFINRLEEGEDGELLVATMDMGLFLYDTNNHSWTQPPSGRISEKNITSLIREGKYIIGGTYGNGAFIWNTDNSDVKTFNRDTLGDPWVLAVAGIGHHFYFGTFGSGLNVLDIKSGEWDRISLAEGISSADIASLIKDNEGNLWAGTLGGGIIRVSGSIYDD
ncbi:MAG: hypothetical protein DRP60_10395 [Spirochaetes bacterium]|nr:MAG: hypothetical protein DRP60_10395 [Spirochaetota bacterium]